jgi:transcriptional regulator of acetoin/glycerol metabolism
VDLGSITPTLFESELLVTKKGHLPMQKKTGQEDLNRPTREHCFWMKLEIYPCLYRPNLLAVLQNREVTRVGSNKPIPVNIRLISATNMPIHNMVYENTFRQDLLI